MEQHIEAGQYLTLALGESKYGLAVAWIREILELQRITRIPRSSEHLLGVINVRGRVVPVVDLRLKLGLPASETTIDSAIVVLETDTDGGESHVGVLVDSVAAVIELDGDEIDEPPIIGSGVESRLIDGMGKRDGEFILLLRIEELFGSEELEAAASATGALA